MSKGEKNAYQCHDCHGVIVTLDLVDGTTPFSMACHVTPGCKGMMTSAFYNVDQTLPHHYEWFTPDSLDGYGDWVREHVEKGGLVIRRREIDLDNVHRMTKDAITVARKREILSSADLQRHMRIAFPDAAMLMIQLIKYGVIYPNRSQKGGHFVVQEINWKQNGRGE